MDAHVPPQITYLSNILQDEHKWIPVEQHLPDFGKKVVIRFWNKDLVLSSGLVKLPENTLLCAEDCAIGVRLRSAMDDDPENDEGVWNICGPYRLVESSPLSRKGELLEGAVVSHWAEPIDSEVEMWEHQQDFRVPFQYVGITFGCDDDANDVYRSLTAAQTLFDTHLQSMYQAQVSEEILNKYAFYRNVIHDLLASIDRGVPIQSKESEDRVQVSIEDIVKRMEEEDDNDDDIPFIELPHIHDSDDDEDDEDDDYELHDEE